MEEVASATALCAAPAGRNTPAMKDREQQDSKYTAPRLDLKLSDFDVQKIVGEGSLSTVVKALWKDCNQIYAIKIIDKFYIARKNMLDAVIRERAVMDAISSDLCVKLCFTFQDEQKLYMGMDLCPHGDLFDQIVARKPLPLTDACFYSAEIVLMLEYLRSKQILYRDLKPENLLLNATGHLKLADFGSAKFADSEDMEALPGSPENTAPADSDSRPTAPRQNKLKPKRAVSFVGTADYVPPEVLSNTSCTYAVDLWGLGCVIYQLIAGKPPFRDKTEYLTMQRISDHDYQCPDTFSDNARDLVDRLLQPEPEDRIGYLNVQEIKDHPYFAGIVWERLRDEEAPAFLKPSATDTSEADRWEMQSMLATLPNRQ